MALQLKGTSEVDALKYSSNSEILVSAELIAASVNISKGKVEESTGIDFVAIIDVSGSMAGSPIALVKTSLKFVVENLKPEDQFSIVCFGAKARVDLPLSKMSPETKQKALQIIGAIKIDTFTNLSDGLFLGIEQLKQRSFENHTSSILLFTDGEANYGITNVTDLVPKMKEQLSKVSGNVPVHAFGFSADHNAGFLTSISDATNGMYYFVAESQKIPIVFAECLGGLLSTVAKDVKLEVTPANGIKVQQIMTKYKVTQSNNQWIVDIGDIYAEEQRNVPITVTVPAISSPNSTQTLVTCAITYFDLRAKQTTSTTIDIAIQRPQEEAKEDESTRAKAIQVDEQRNRVTAASALETATNFGVSGKLPQAKQTIQDAIFAMQASKSRNTTYTQSLISDLQEALTRMDTSSDFNHMAAKYLYSMSRQHYNQRSSGVSLSGANAYLTSTKKAFMGIEDKQEVKKIVTTNSTVVTKNNGKPTLEGSRKDKTVVSKETMAKSIRRLMSDLAEIQKYPLETVTAHPLESDVFEWHCNMRGPMGSPYANTIFHLVFIFPQNYPVEPPKLFNCTFIEHEHVYGTWVCLDLLEEAQWSGTETNKPYTGWTSAYSVQSILLQLQSFLFDKASIDENAVKKAEKSSQQFRCDQCGHNSNNVWPKFPVMQNNKREEYRDIVVNKDRVVLEAFVETIKKEGKQETVSVPVVTKEVLVAKETKIVEDKKPSPKVEVVPVVTKPVVAKEQQPVVQQPVAKQQEPEVKQQEVKKEEKKTEEPKKQEVTIKTAPATVKLVANSQWKAVPSTLWTAPTASPAPTPVKTLTKPKAVVQVEEKKPQVKPEKKPEVKPQVEKKPEQKPTKSANPKNKPKDDKPVVQLKPNQSLWAKPPATLYQSPKAAEPPVVAKPVVVKENVVQQSVAKQQAEPEVVKKEEKKNKEEKKATPIVPIQVEVKGAWAARKATLNPTVAKEQPAAQPVAKEQQPVAKEQSVAKEQVVAQPVVKEQVVAKAPEVVAKQPEAKIEPVTQVTKKVESIVKKEQPVKKIITAKKGESPLVFALSQIKNAKGMESSYFTFLYDDVIIRIFSFLSIKDLALVSMVCKDFLRLSCDYSLWKTLFTQYYPGSQLTSRTIQAWKHIFATERTFITQGLVCFHTRVSFRDTVLGIPISYSTNPRTGIIDKITSTLDLLSYEAYFEENVRKSVWKVPFTHWLPLYINREHGERALPLMQQTLATLCGKNKFKPEMALEVIPKLMNTMVVNLMSGDVHASIAALEGYCAFHRLLLFFVSKYPELQDTVNMKAISFVRNEDNRHKDVMPSLGEFLPLLTVSNKVTWKEAAMPYLYENFDRNALWTLKKYPALATPEADAISWDRLNKTFDATQVSIRLLMFHVYFFNKVARPEGVSLDSVANNYDAFYGRPSSQMKEALQKKCKEILGIKGWPEFFTGIGMAAPGPQYLTKWLKDAVKNSLRKGYHSKNLR